MLLKKLIGTLFAFQFAVLPSLAQAQSSDFDRGFARQGAEARISFTIPLGNSSDKTKTAPRLNLGVGHYAPSSTASTDWMRADGTDYRDVNLGFTLEATPKLMMNEKILRLPENEQTNLGTAGKIGLGVAAVALIYVAAFSVALINYSDEE